MAYSIVAAFFVMLFANACTHTKTNVGASTKKAQVEQDTQQIKQDITALLSDIYTLAAQYTPNEDEGVLGFVTDDDTATNKESIPEMAFGAFNEGMDDIQTKTINTNSIEYIQRPLALEEDFSGYKIELVSVYNKPLTFEDGLFKQFGNMRFVTEGNKTTYYLGNFTSKKGVEDFLTKVVATRFPDAKGVKFENGVQVKY